MSAITWSEATLYPLSDAAAPALRAILMDGDGTAWSRLATKLSAIETLRDDWDGLGGAAPSPAIVRTANRLFALRREQEPNTPPKRIIVAPDGSIVFEWRIGRAALQIQIDEPDQANYVLEVPGEAPMFWSERFDTTRPETTWEDDRQYPSATG